MIKIKIKKKLVTLILAFTALSMFGQSYNISGTISDETDKSIIVGAITVLTNTDDTTQTKVSVSDRNGNFMFSAKPGNYNLKISYVGYDPLTKAIQCNKNIALSTISLKKKVERIDEVIVTGQIIPVVQKGDTTEMSAGAYKLNVDANADDLVKKMPGVTVEDGKVKAQGEAINRVLVDGKNFLGDDPMLALQNLPAEVIDKVQVYNKMSEQSEFTGFDDGKSIKVMNIVTRVDRRQGANGKFSAGYGKDNLYDLSGRVNLMSESNRINVNGGSNNIGQQSFSNQDLISSGGGQRGGGGSYSGGSGGISKTNKIGFDYTYIGKKLAVNTSYFYNTRDNNTTQNSNTEYLGITDTSRQAMFQDSKSESNSMNYNHRFDSKIEWDIDSSNQLVFSPRLSYQKNDKDQLSDILKFNSSPDLPLLSSNSKSINNSSANSFSGNLVLKHKFNKKGRTISGDFGYSDDNSKTDGTNASTDQSGNRTLITSRLTDNKEYSYEASSRLSYTEPISTKSSLQASYRVSLSKNWADRNIWNTAVEPPVLLDLISNDYETYYNRQSGGLGYSFVLNENIRTTVGTEYQNANLQGISKDTIASDVDKTFASVLPNANVNIKFSKNSNLRVSYNTSTRAPSVSQLNEMVNISSSLNFSKGNAQLKPTYSHSLRANYRHSNPENYTNYSININGTYNLDPISSKTEILLRDTVINGQQLLRNGQFRTSVNMDNSWNTSLFANYSFLFKPIKCNLTIPAGLSYSTSPGYINYIKSITSTYQLNSGLTVASNISENVDFTVQYNVSYSIYDNNNQPTLNSNTWYHNITLNSVFTFFGSIVLTNRFSESITRGMGSSYNTSYMRWNAEIAKKILKNKRGQISISANDILNQVKNVNRNVSETSIVDSRTNLIGRYYLLTFTYTLRKYKGQGSDKSGNDRNRQFGPRDGGPQSIPGGMDGGGGGGRRGGNRGPGGF
jgi:hypothetical protein